MSAAVDKSGKEPYDPHHKHREQYGEQREGYQTQKKLIDLVLCHFFYPLLCKKVIPRVLRVG